MNAAFFTAEPEEITRASAPGRLDVMGGVADYSGALVLQMPIAEQTHAALARRADGTIRVRSEMPGASNEREATVELGSDEREQLLASDAHTRRTRLGWAAYVVGAVVEFHHALATREDLPLTGYDILITSEVPPGRGVSASAALEMAVLRALQSHWAIEVPPLELAVIGQRAEHRWAAAPCGLMDQIASHCGVPGHVLPIVCRADEQRPTNPAQLLPTVAIPDCWHFIGIDSGVTHHVSGDAYGIARTAAFMGLEILRKTGAGLLKTLRKTGTGHLELPPEVNDFSAGEMDKNASQTGTGHLGRKEDETRKTKIIRYLSEVCAKNFDPEALPESLCGATFLEEHGGTSDTVTKVRPGSNYPVRAAASHPVFEEDRIQRFLQLLQTNRMAEAGPLMFESHRSYSEIGLGHPETDKLVRDLQTAGPSKGIHGARVTGGGCGGTVCVLAEGSHGLETAIALAGLRTVFRVKSQKHRQESSS